MNETTETSSHSERDIYNGCMELMNKLMDNFEWYLDYVGIKVDELGEDERFKLGISNFEIVQTLFLQHTDHAGGTSTLAKCEELGLDSSDRVYFELTGEVPEP